MPKLYKEGEIPPYKTKEYYRQKIRDFRAKKPSIVIKMYFGLSPLVVKNTFSNESLI